VSTRAIDFSDLGGKLVSDGQLDFSDLGGRAVSQSKLDKLRAKSAQPTQFELRGGYSEGDRFASPIPEDGILSKGANFVRGAVSTVTAPLLHPVETIQGMGKAQLAGGFTPYGAPITSPTGNRQIDQQNEQVHRQAQQEQLDSTAQQVQEHPYYTGGSYIGPMLLGEAANIPEVRAAMDKAAAPIRNAVTNTRQGATGATAQQTVPTSQGGPANAASPQAGSASFGRLKQTGARFLPALIDGPPESLVTRAAKPGNKNIRWEADLKTALPEMKAAEAELGHPVQNLEDAVQVAGTAKKALWKQYEDILRTAQESGGLDDYGRPRKAGSSVIDGNQIADAMTSSVDRRTATLRPELVERVKKIADTYRRPLDVSEAEDFLQSANNELHSYYAKNKVGRRAAAADPETAALVAEAETLRSALYSKLDELGPGAKELKRTYGALTNVEEVLVNRKNVAARQQPESLQEQLSMVRGAGKIAKGVLTGSPGDVIEGTENIAVSRAIKARNTSDAMLQRAFKASNPSRRVSYDSLIGGSK
jgi:hypothetical protein